MAAPFQFMPGQAMGPPPMAGPVQIDPAQNNMPLQFNMAKGKPPLPLEAKEVSPHNLGEDGSPKDDIQHVAMSGADSTSPVSTMPMAGMPGMMPPPMAPMPFNPMMGGMPNDPMMGPMGYAPYGGFMSPMPGLAAPIKQPVHLKNATLYPPPMNAPPPSVRERPPGCRTIFVGGLPETCTDEILRELFESCGPICSIRMSKKNFSHLRFDNEESVDKAIYISGYRMKINDLDDKPNTGRLHVDYAQARDDLYEWECKQRVLAREERHRMRIEEERLRPPSPPPVVHYSEHEAGVLMDRLKGDDSFMKAAQILCIWLERGDCTKRSANNFYSMVQSTNAHIRRLMNEKAQHDEEFEQMKEKYRQQMEGVLRQMEQIEKVFGAASLQKAWDHFSKAQRKNIDLWHKQAKDVYESHQTEYLQQREEREMDLSDSEDSEPMHKKQRQDAGLVEAELLHYRDENDQLKCQLEAYRNEVELLKQEEKNKTDERTMQIKALQHALQGMQQQLIEARRKPAEETSKKEGSEIPGSSGLESTVVSSQTTSPALPSEKDTRLLGLISVFLHVHPFGASTDYIWSYLQQLKFTIRAGELETLLEGASQLFRQKVHGVGASLERRWHFIGFDPGSL